MVKEQIIEAINKIGDYIPSITERILKVIEDQGLIANNITARLVSILVLLGIFWLTITFSNVLKKPIAWGIKILSIILIISIIFSTFVKT